MTTNESTIGIVGAGIGGLVAAISLRGNADWVYGYDAWAVPVAAQAAPASAS